MPNILHHVRTNASPFLTKCGLDSYEISPYFLHMGKEELLDSRVKAIKANIERILTAKKQTKLWLAEQCNGKSSGWMTHILSGRSKIKMEDINLIAQALGCTTTDLMASEDDPLAPLIQDIRGLPEKYRTQLEALIEVFKKAP